jgi:hypothetical protein
LECRSSGWCSWFYLVPPGKYRDNFFLPCSCLLLLIIRVHLTSLVPMIYHTSSCRTKFLTQFLLTFDSSNVYFVLSGVSPFTFLSECLNCEIIYILSVFLWDMSLRLLYLQFAYKFPK